MPFKTFSGGVHPPSFKELTSGKPVRKAPLPKKVILPLIQHTGTPCKPTVGAGDYVKRGQLIAGAEAFITSPIHSTISGTVKEISRQPHPVLGECEAIVIESDGRDVPHGSISSAKDPDSLSPEDMLAKIKRCGIVGLGGAAFPTHVKLSPPEGKPIDAVLLNGTECEPYLNCDYRLMVEKPKKVLKGLAIIMKVLGVNSAYIAIEDNKIEASSAIRTALSIKTLDARYQIQMVLLETKYPQGGEKQVIDAVLGRKVPPGKLPFEVGCVVSNVGTAYAIYEAIYENKPLYERVITLSGNSLNEPQNILARIGTPLSELVEFCGGFKDKAKKIVFGGPMMGIGQYTLDTPIIKGTSGIVFLSEKETKPPLELPCIKCARCVDVCPVSLIPTRIYQLAKNENWESISELNPTDCIECGACSYECPSKIPLLHYIKVAKEVLSKK